MAEIGTQPDTLTAAARRRDRVIIGLVCLAAVAMAWPSLGGGFLGGDDVTLVRDHVLVNRPSLDHAVKLFGIVHRDLYQPVPMLSFMLDFAVIDALGLRDGGPGSTGGVWVFHCTNILLHALNAVLVFLLARRLTGDAWIAGAAAVLFAVHPLNVETVAWINGRMMLLSTLFLLGAVIASDRLRNGGGWGTVAWVLVLTALCMMSKVRVCLPALLAAPPLLAWRRPPQRWWIAWGGATLLTVASAWINLGFSSEMVSGGEAQLHGPRLVRVVLALGWYLSRVFGPIGLCPYHPPIDTVSWSLPGLWIPVVGLVVLAGVVIASARRTRLGWVGLLWFCAAIAATLPLVPTRNLSVAERYTYLPHIGLYLVIAALLVHAARRWSRPALSTAVAAGVVLGLLSVSWRACGDYRDDIARTERMVALYGDYPGIHRKHGWSFYFDGRYHNAIEQAEIAIRDHAATDEAEALQLIGLARLRRGETQSAITALERAVAIAPEDGQAHARLARALRAAGRDAEALSALKRCAELAPNYNPGLLDLAEAYARANRSGDAQRVLQQVLENNPYDSVATMRLAEMEIAAGNFPAALARLETLLAWMPEHVPARVAAGVCLAETGNPQAAANAYAEALRLDPGAAAAAINLANLLVANGNHAAALARLNACLVRNPSDRAVIALAVDIHLGLGRQPAAARLLSELVAGEPDAPDLRGLFAWVRWLGGQWQGAVEQAEAALASGEQEYRATMVMCGDAVRRGEPDAAVELTTALIEGGALQDPRLFDAFAAVLQTCAAADDSNPWPYYLLAMACRATGRDDTVRLVVEECLRRTNDPALRERANSLIPNATNDPP